MLFRSGVFIHTIPTISSALSPSRCLPPPHLSPYQVRSLQVGDFHFYSFPPYHVRSLPVGVFLPHTIPTISSALSPSQCLPRSLILFQSQMRSLSVGVSLPQTSPTLSSALSPSRCLSPPFPSTFKCALSQSVSSSTPFQPYQVRSLPVGISLPHISRLIKCALSQSVSPSPTPFPPYQVRSLPVGVSHLHTIRTLSSAPFPSLYLPPPLISFHSQVRSLPVRISLPYTTPTLKCALSQSVSLSSTPFPPYQVRPLPVFISLKSFLSTLKCALSQSVSPPHHSNHIKCALSQSLSSSPTPFPPYQVRSLPVFISLSY